MSLNFGRTSTGTNVAPQEMLAAVAYPNPGSDLLNIKVNAARDLGKTRLVMTDLTGRTVLEERLNWTGNGGRHILDISMLPNGTYTLEMLTEAGVARQRVMVQH